MSAADTYHPHELIPRLRAGDKVFFYYLYNLYWQELYAAAFYILHDKEACMDVVQDVFLWLWEHRQTIQMESPKAYLKAAVKFQPGAQDKWLKAIHDDHIGEWTQVSELNYFNNAAAKAYGIQAIPQNFLVDPSGKIVARNLRGAQLMEQLQQIFDR